MDQTEKNCAIDGAPDLKLKWLHDAHRHLLRGKQLILHGNVHDIFRYQEKNMSVSSILCKYFADDLFQAVFTYDVVDGGKIEVADRAKELIRQFQSVSSIAPNTSTTSSRVVKPESVESSGNVLDHTNSVNALTKVRAWLSQDQIPTAVIVNHFERVFATNRQEEQRVIVLVQKIYESAAIIAEGELKYRRNAFAMIAEDLGSIPTAAYRNHPLVAIVNIPRPDQEERRKFYLRSRMLHQDEKEIAASTFSAVTDGLTTIDLQSIELTSRIEEANGSQFSSPRELVSFYRYGEKEDPWKNLSSEKMQSAHSRLTSRVIGQDAAVNSVCRMLVDARVGLAFSTSGQSTKPKGVFFFVGPTGTGKTELAKSLAELIFGDEKSMARFDMSEYKEEHTSQKLIGAPPGYAGYGEGGILTNRVLEKPFSLLLFDEIEKAHPKILDMFLQILDDGRLTDSRGQTADFSQSLVVFTSNIGADKILGPSTQDQQKDSNRATAEIYSSMLNRRAAQLISTAKQELPSYDGLRLQFIQMVKQHFNSELKRPELLSRLGNGILVFDLLRPQFVKQITQKYTEALVKSAVDKQIQIDIDSEGVAEMMLSEFLADSEAPMLGGRRLGTIFQDKVVHEISNYIAREVGLDTQCHLSVQSRNGILAISRLDK